MKSSFRLALMSMSLVSAFAMAAGEIYSNQGTDRRVPALNPQLQTKSGLTVATVSGGAQSGFWSEVQHNPSDPTSSNTNAGSNLAWFNAGTTPKYRMADDFVVTGGKWIVDKVRFYCYATGTTTAPYDGGNVRIWQGRPFDNGSTIIYDGFNAGANNGSGDPTTVSSSIIVDPAGTTANVFRIFNTVAPTGTAPGVTRRIWQIEVDIPDQTLADGTYWVDVQAKSINGATSGFSPSTTHEGLRGVAGANARQMTGLDHVNQTWIDLIDAGNPATAADVPQEMVFVLTGKFIRDAMGFDVVQGEEFAGDLSSVMTSDDNRHEFFNDASTLACEVIYRGVGNLQGCASMNVKVELAVARPGLAHEISQYNHATSNFVFLSGAGSTQTDSFFDIFVTTNLDGYMQNDLRTKIKWAPINDEDATQDGWTHMVDYVKWEIAP